MKKIEITTILFACVCFFCSFKTVTAQEWKKITPLKTNCAELMKILEVKKCNYPVSYYKFEKYEIDINFSTKDDGWGVSRDTVVRVIIVLRVMIKLKDFETDLSGYKIKPETDIPSLIYRNDKKGIEFTTQNPEGDEEFVTSVTLFPCKIKKQ